MEKFLNKRQFISFLIILIIFIHLGNGQSFIIPNLSSISTLNTSSILYGSLSNLKSFSNIIGRLSTTGRLDIWSTNNITNHIYLQSGTGILSNQTQPILDFSFAPDYLNYLGIVFNTTLKIINTSNLNILRNIQIDANQYRNISILSEGIYAIDNSKRLLRYSRTNFTNFNTYLLSFVNPTIKLSTCQSSRMGQIAITYSANSRVQPVRCTDAGCVQVSYLFDPIYAGWQINYPYTDQTCQILYYQADYYRDLYIVNISNGQNFKNFTNLGQDIYGYAPLDTLNAYSAVFLQNNSILIYDNDPLKVTDYLVKVIDNLTLSPIMNYNLKTNIFWTASNDYIQFYQFRCPQMSYMQIQGLCKSCDQTCKTCSHLTGYCYQCISYSYDLYLGKCYKSGIKFQSQIATISVQGFQNFSPILNYVFFFFLLSPLGSSYLLKFINFWAICSLYALLEIQSPAYLGLILQKIYDQLNQSLLTPLKISLDFISQKFALNQKFSNSLVQNYKIASNFLDMNLQNLLIFFLSLIILSLPYLIKQYLLKQNTQLYSLLSLNFLWISLNKFIGICSNFFFSIQILTIASYQDSIRQKTNVLFYVIFIGLGFISPFVSICVMDKKPLNQQHPKCAETNNRSKGKISTKRKLYNRQIFYQFFNYECNIIFPFLVMIGYKWMFFVLNFVFLVFGLYASYKQSKFSVNKLIMSSYLMLFHVCFIGMYIFSIHEYKKVNHYFGLFSLFFLIIGGIHETLSLFFQILYQFIHYFKKVRKIYTTNHKISNKQQKSINKDNNKLQIKSLFLMKKFKQTDYKKQNKTKIKNRKIVFKSTKNQQKLQQAQQYQDFQNIKTQYIDNHHIKNPDKTKKQISYSKNIKSKKYLSRKHLIKHQLKINSIGG